jgi:cytoskeletal protein RodZ
MSGFVRKKVNSQTLGEKLQEIRRTADVSLNEIAKATKVRKKYLEMLEQGKHDQLPPDVYVKGFLTNYAKYLSIEVSDVISLYEKERGVAKNIKKLKTPKEARRKFQIPSITVTPKVLTLVLFVVFVGIGFAYFYREVGKFSAAPRLVIVQPAGNSSIEGNSVDVVGITDKDTKVSINGQPVFVDEKGEFNETISLSQGINELEVKSENRFGNEAAKKVRVSASYDTQFAQNDDNDEKVMGVHDENEKVVLEIKIIDSPTWISVQVDGESTHRGTMLPNSVQSFEAEEKVSVTSGKANKTIVTLNGNELGSLGETTSVIRDVVFTRETTIIPESSFSQPPEENQEEEKKEEE